VLDRAVEVYARVGEEWSCGSGVWLSDRLVVTAAHVVFGSDGPAPRVCLEVGYSHSLIAVM
jgi:hypothetical protein